MKKIWSCRQAAIGKSQIFFPDGDDDDDYDDEDDDEEDEDDFGFFF